MKHNYSEILPKLVELLKSDYVTEPTRKVLLERIQHPAGKNIFFNDEQYHLLSVVCDLLLDQKSGNRIVEIAYYIDQRLTENKKDGWRYNNMPPDGDMYRLGLTGIQESSMKMFDKPFLRLPKCDQLAVLLSVQNGKAGGSTWEKMSSKTFFEELLSESAELFFSHPIVQADMGYVGMADAKGWNKIGFEESESIENYFD